MEEDPPITLRRHRDRPETVDVNYSVIRDIRLSAGARHLFILLDTLPPGWQPVRKHLSYLAGCGRDALGSRIKSLREVGALQITEHRLDDQEARDLNSRLKTLGLPEKYRAGQVYGQSWEIVDPALWAVEAPLRPDGKTPGAGFPGTRHNRPPGNLPLRGLTTVGVNNHHHQEEPPGGGGEWDEDQVEKLLAAAIWGETQRGRDVGPTFRGWKKTQLLLGPTERDLDLLRAYNLHLEKLLKAEKRGQRADAGPVSTDAKAKEELNKLKRIVNPGSSHLPA